MECSDLLPVVGLDFWTIMHCFSVLLLLVTVVINKSLDILNYVSFIAALGSRVEALCAIRSNILLLLMLFLHAPILNPGHELLQASHLSSPTR